MSNNFSNFSNFPNSIGGNIGQPTQNSTVKQATLDYSPFIIKPPDRNKTHGTTTKHIVIDSRDRDYLQFPTSSSYRVEVTEDLRDVTSIELSLAQIPNTYYNISDKNNVFYIEETDSSLSAINIPEGQYTNDLMISTLNGEFGNLFRELTNKYNFTRNPINLKLRIQSNRKNNTDFIYNLNYFKEDNCRPCNLNSIDTTIGFLNQKYQSEEIDLSNIYVLQNNITNLNMKSKNDFNLYELTKNDNNDDFKELFEIGDYLIIGNQFSNVRYSIRITRINNSNTITFESLDNLDPIGIEGNIFRNISVLVSPNIFQLDNKPYVILKINDAKLLNSINASNNAYTIIPLMTKDNTIVNYSTIPVHGVIKYYNPPLGRLFYMDIEFVNYDGTLFNFRGQENMLLFIISLLNQPGKYNNYVDTN